ncbi:MAG: class I SAM-dependent methyltransferase [Micropepsaceae bacterium]
MTMEEQKFDKLYFDFWKPELFGERLERECNLIVQIAELAPGSAILDLGAGIGRISFALADRGMKVIAVERSDIAVAEAALTPHPRCQFITGNWRDRPWGQQQFDCALLWFTTLCAGRTFDVETLAIARSALVDHGTLLLETRHWDRPNRQFDRISERRSSNGRLIENHAYDPATGIQTTEEHFMFASNSLRRKYEIRRYSFAELREMCLQVGFHHVDGYDERGRALSNESERAVLCARLN